MYIFFNKIRLAYRIYIAAGESCLKNTERWEGMHQQMNIIQIEIKNSK